MNAKVGQTHAAHLPGPRKRLTRWALGRNSSRKRKGSGYYRIREPATRPPQMTGFDHRWVTHPRLEEEQQTVLTVHFRPDKEPKDKAEWFEWLSNYASTMSKLYGAEIKIP